MLAKAVFAIFAVAAQVVVATPPACLLAAVNTQSDPSDIQSVCKDGASDVQKYLSSNCGDNLDAATSAFADTCKSAGVTISSSSPTKSSTAGDSTHTGTKTPSLSSATLTNGAVSGFHTQTSTNSGTDSAASPTGTSSSDSTSDSDPSSSSDSTQAQQTGVDTSTGGAARLSMDILGLAAIGLAGFMLAM